MTARAQPVSRRWFIGAGAAIACSGLPPGATAQPAADGFRLLRARALPSTGLGNTGLGYDGIAPGPTLRVRRGDELRVRLVNELAAADQCALARHPAANAMDGVPQLTQPAVAPGASFDYRFRPPDAGTFWYHAYIAGQTDRGLAGAFIVEDTQPVDVDREIALLLTTPAAADGPPVLVNGSVRPDIAVKTGERLRLADRQRHHGARPLRQARWTRGPGDGDRRPARRAIPRTRQPRGARTRQRIDLFIDTDGRCRGHGAASRRTADRRESGATDRAAGLRARWRRSRRASIGAAAAAAQSAPGAHRSAKLAQGRTPARERPRTLDPAGPPLFTVKRGRAVTLAIRNSGSHPHVMHLHGHSFRVLDRLDDGWKPFWMDTLVVGDQIERIAFVADNPGKWLIECAALERQDGGTAVWFAVN
jgi:FtsP/CotA-like multicopper oxidase with cupredoxin domain